MRQELEDYLLRLTKALNDMERKLASWPALALQGENVTFIETTVTNVIVGEKVILHETVGVADVYWTYNSTTGYLEGWVEGVKRIEL